MTAESHLVVITGGIGAGKTTIMKRLASMGAHCIDADDVAHSLYEPRGTLVNVLAEHFGPEILDAEGCLDRKALAARVFGNDAELKWLNGITHPAIRQRIAEAAEAVAPEPLFAAIPLWYECGWASPDVPVIATWCSASTQLERLRLRGWSDSEIQRRIASQVPMDEKFARADYGIVTDCSWERLDEQCAEIYRTILSDTRN